jgi:CRP-like cAMP-binding protein
MSPARLLAHDVDLGAGITDPDRLRSAMDTVVVDELTLGTGDELDVRAFSQRAGLGALLLSGYLVREIKVADRVSADLAGPGDLLYPSHWEPSDGLFSYTVSWAALGRTRLALLDESVCQRIAPWPEIGCALLERARRPGDRAALGRAIARSSTVEVRLLMSLWHWASSWSSVTAEGVRLDVPLSHERLARLIGASRPTITTAIGRLRKAGYLGQRRNGQWLLVNPVNGPPSSADVGPELETGRLHVPPDLAGRARIRSPWELSGARRPDLYARIAEQRELLRVAADRHAAELVRLRDRSERLRATAELSELARQAREWPDESRIDESEAG